MAPPPEIAIPSTSISDEGSSKLYTLYNITLRLPLRSFVVQKRYSDFEKLHRTLVEQVGEAPPEPLPAKHWLKSTVTSPDLTKDRQSKLELYLRTVAETPDRRWRDTSAWRAFLNLPSSSTTNSAVSAGGSIPSHATGAADPGTWLEVHRELRQVLQDARQQLTRRDAAKGADASNSSTTALEAGAAANRALAKAGTLISTLTDGLRKIQDAKRLGEGELLRRRDMVTSARLEREGLEKLARNSISTNNSTLNGGNSYNRIGEISSSPPSSTRANLLKGATGGGGGARPGTRVLGAPRPETAKTRELDNAGVLLLQKEEMQAQDMQVDQLAAIIRRQKEQGILIGDEVERQTEMLGLLDEDATRLAQKLKIANKRVQGL